jgi:hypothetical protein
MRLLYLPWIQLTPMEQETALREARRRGAWGARAEQDRCEVDHADPVPIARPTLYVIHLQLVAPTFWFHRWRGLTAAELCADLRVCYHGDGWERERRALAGEPALPRDVARLARRVSEAQEAWVVARREQEVAVRRCGGLRSGHPARLEAAKALLQMRRAEEEYWLAVMLARTAGWEPASPGGFEPTEVRW